MAHLTPSNTAPTSIAGGHTMGQQADLGTMGALEFRECALLVGSRVTCVGEVVRDHSGNLSMCPWRPPSVVAQLQHEGGKGRLSKTSPWFSPSWENMPIRKSPAVQADPLAGHVLIS